MECELQEEEGMFRLRKGREIEFTRIHMLAVRLVDAINFEASSKIEGFEPIFLGFRLRITEEQDPRDSLLTVRPKIHVRPARWPKECFIEALLVQRDGWLNLQDGRMVSPWGSFDLVGDDTGTVSYDYKPRPVQFRLSIISPR